MSKFTDLEKDAASVDGFVNENGLIPTRRNGPKPSWQYLVDGWNAEIAATILEVNKSRGFRVVGEFADGFTYELFNDVGIDADGNSWIYVGAGAPNKVVAAGTVPSVSDGYEQVTFNSASGISDANGGSVQDFIDSFALKIFQSPTNVGLTEIQTRTVDADEVYEVRKTSDDSLATIYSDAAGTTEISQNGTDNKSGSDGVVEFYIADGDYYVEVGGVKSNFNAYREGVTPRKMKSICFIFDDGYETAKTVVKPLFDSYGKRFGIAIPYGSLPNPNRLGLQGVKELYSQGVEVINHASSGDVMNSISKGYGAVRGELATNWSGLAAIGVNTTGFQTPSSILNSEFLPIVRSFSKYAFTKSSSSDVIRYGTDTHELHRMSIESSTEQDCLDAIDNLVASDDGAIVFYAHSIDDGDDNYLKIVSIIEYAEENSIDVLSPNQCISRSVNSLPSVDRVFYEGETLFNNPNMLTLSGGGSVAVNATSKDLTLTLPTAGDYLLQETYNFNSLYNNIESMVNFSSLIRDLAGTISSCKIGMRMYTGDNATGTMLLQAEEDEINLNNTYVRYYQELIKGTAKSVLFYIRLTSNGSGSVLLREPTLRFGSSIQGIRYTESEEPVDSGFGLEAYALTSQTIPATAALEYIDLPTIDNELFSTSGTSVVFKRDATIEFNISVISSGAGITTGWLGGAVSITDGAKSFNTAPISGGDEYLAGSTSVVVKVKSADVLRVRALSKGAPFVISTSSRLTISEI